MTRSMLRRVFFSFMLCFAGFTYSAPVFRYFAIPQFMLDYYEYNHAQLWLVEYDTFTQLRCAVEKELNNRHNLQLPALVKRPTVTTNIGFEHYAIKYVPIRPIEFVSLLPYLQWDGCELKTNPGQIVIMAGGSTITISGLGSYQLYHYFHEIIGRIEEQGLPVLRSA